MQSQPEKKATFELNRSALESGDLVRTLCSELVSTPSFSGKEEELVSHLKTVFRQLGFDPIMTDDYGSIIAEISGDQPGPTILLDAHIDTVGVTNSEQWTHDPFGGEIADGKIFGRGTSDMKGALAAMIAGVVQFNRLSQGHFKGKIVISGTVHEECFEGVAAGKVVEQVKPDAVIIGEATELRIAHGQRGRAEIVLESFGKQCHSSAPQNGINAVWIMHDILDQIKQLPVSSDDVLGNGILALTDILSAPYPGASVIPDYCKVTFDRRTLPGETEDTVLNPIRDIIEQHAPKHGSGRVSVSISTGEQSCYTGSTIQSKRFFPAWLYKPEDKQISAATQALAQAGLDHDLCTYSFCTNGSYFAGIANIPTLGYGPSKETLAHTCDESIEISQLEQAVSGYAAIVGALLKVM